MTLTSTAPATSLATTLAREAQAALATLAGQQATARRSPHDWQAYLATTRAMTAQQGLAETLLQLHDLDPDAADQLARRLAAEWTDGATFTVSLGELLTRLGVDPEDVNHEARRRRR